MMPSSCTSAPNCSRRNECQSWYTAHSAALMQPNWNIVSAKMYLQRQTNTHAYTNMILKHAYSQELARKAQCNRHTYTKAMSTTAHFTKYTAIQCTYICSAFCRWLVLSQMEHWLTHFFLPFAVRHPGTFSALNLAGSVSVNPLSTESQCLKCTSAR